MTWSEQSPAEPPWTTEPIRPHKIFYAFDGPLIFSAKIGFFDALFFKFDEIDESELYLICPTNDLTLNAISNGDISLRGALSVDQIWIMQTDSALRIEKYWTSLGDDFPASFLPARRVGLHPGTPSPDSLDEANALFALNFQGPGLTRKGMAFGTFRNIVDSAHDAIRRILIPELLSGVRSSTLDFEMTEPKFSSLVIALKEPIINQEKVARKLVENSKPEVISHAIEKNSAGFVDELGGLASSAIKGEISAAEAREKFVFLDRVSGIVPSDSNKLSELSVTSNVNGHRKMIAIGEDTGEKILRARQLAIATPVVDIGPITQIRGRRNTFVIQSVRGKEITCSTDDLIFKALVDDPRFKYGTRVRVEGLLTIRTIRDWMTLTKAPILQ